MQAAKAAAASVPRHKKGPAGSVGDTIDAATALPLGMVNRVAPLAEE
jgi:hypothetical protein